MFFPWLPKHLIIKFPLLLWPLSLFWRLFSLKVFLGMLSPPAHLYPLPVHSHLSYNIDFALSADATYFSTQIVSEIQSYKFKCHTLLLLWEVLSSSRDAAPQTCCSSSFSVKGVIITIQVPKLETWASPSSPPLFKPTTFQQAPSSAHSAPIASVQVKSWDYFLLDFYGNKILTVQCDLSTNAYLITSLCCLGPFTVVHFI